MLFTIYETEFSADVDYAEVDLDKSKYKYSFEVENGADYLQMLLMAKENEIGLETKEWSESAGEYYAGEYLIDDITIFYPTERDQINTNVHVYVSPRW